MAINAHSRLSPSFLIERLILREGVDLIFTLDPSKADPTLENITQQYYIRLLYKPHSTDSFNVVNEVTHIFHSLYQNDNLLSLKYQVPFLYWQLSLQYFHLRI